MSKVGKGAVILMIKKRALDDSLKLFFNEKTVNNSEKSLPKLLPKRIERIL